MHFTSAADFDVIPAEVTHIRLWDVGVAWKDIHTGPDVYNWTLLDSLVAKAGNRHLTYVIAGCPRWLAKYPNQGHYAPWLGPGSNSMPYSIDEANKFVWNLATRYKGRIKAYEVWNEPQLADFLYPYTDAECNTLATMTKRFFKTIKAQDPAALVLAASVLPRESSGGMNRARRYLAAMQRANWNVDAFTCHIYPEVGFWAPRWKNMLQDVVSTLKSMGTPTSKLWITETLYGLLGPELTDAAALDTAVKALYEGDGGRFVFWYAWDRPDLGGSMIANGKPTWDAIKAHHTK
jgi:polysaccharide biosynthesis protein PslG